MIATEIDSLTRAWIRNESDRSAARKGCRFDLDRAMFAVWWIERHCRLYEGREGDPLRLRGCQKCDTQKGEIPHEWNDKTRKIYYKRAGKHCQCQSSGHDLDWQFECTARFFGWVKSSKQWGRDVRRFRQASIWVAKKNKKSPTLAAWGMYLLCGDGEPGQKVFLGAKDGQQVRENAARHAAEMVQQSPELAEGCIINKVKASIFHPASKSLMIPLSSSNSSNQKGKEGLNGSVLIDETHVVDRAFIKRISRAGISRAEPVFAEFSTAGNEPDGYGAERFDYASKVLRGEVDNPDLFVAIYAAPADVTDAELDADPIRYGRMANPAWGHTVDPAEYLADYRNSKDRPSDLLDFKMYRLNIWQNASNPWLKLEDWRKGRKSFSIEDMYGMPCWSALDLSSVKDFTSLCLCFPMGGEAFRCLWWYWLPEDTARIYRPKMPIDDWMKSPRVNLILTPGARIHYGGIRSMYRELAKKFDIQELTYDDWNAEQTTQELSEGVTDAKGVMIEPATGIERVNFSQSMKMMNEPTKKFEAAVIDGLVEHNGDELTEWMIRNATIKPDGNGNYKPMKPDHHSLQKIDGVITAIMAKERAGIAEYASVADMLGFI